MWLQLPGLQQYVDRMLSRSVLVISFGCLTETYLKLSSKPHGDLLSSNWAVEEMELSSDMDGHKSSNCVIRAGSLSTSWIYWVFRFLLE